jgi:hypothetical protein
LYCDVEIDEFVVYHCPLDGLQELTAATWDAVWTDFTRNGHAFTRWGIAVGPPAQ